MNKTIPSPFAGLIRTVLPTLGVAIALFATSALSTAAILISTDDKAPTDNIYKANLPTASPGNVTFYYRGLPRPQPSTPDVIRTIGQGLSTAGAPTPLNMSAITFLISSAHENVLGMTLQLTIHQTSSPGGVPSPDNIIQTHTGTLPDTMAKGDYLTLSLDTPLTLQPNKHYAFICSFTQPTSTDTNAISLSFVTIGSGLNNLDSSRRWISSDGTFDASPSNGFVFYVQATAIPEPGAYAILGLVLISLGTQPRLWNPRRP